MHAFISGGVHSCSRMWKRSSWAIRARTSAAIRRGELTPLPCAVCGSPRAEAHHRRYDTEEAHLDVTWLCDSHHALEHGKHPWTDQIELFPTSG